jgi:hypothetical protein
MTLEIDEKRIAANLDGIKKIADAKNSSQSGGDRYRQMYGDYLRAYSDIGLYITTVGDMHVVVKSDDL